jgi:hypothetical protein
MAAIFFLKSDIAIMRRMAVPYVSEYVGSPPSITMLIRVAFQNIFVTDSNAV